LQNTKRNYTFLQSYNARILTPFHQSGEHVLERVDVLRSGVTDAMTHEGPSCVTGRGIGGAELAARKLPFESAIFGIGGQRNKGRPRYVAFFEANRSIVSAVLRAR
jgi:hypothetical protein